MLKCTREGAGVCMSTTATTTTRVERFSSRSHKRRNADAVSMETVGVKQVLCQGFM